MTQSEYRQHKIKTFQFPNEQIQLSIVRFKDLLVLGLDVRVIHKVIDVMKDNQLTISGDPQFKKNHANALVHSDLSSYVLLRPLLDQLFFKALDLIKSSSSLSEGQLSKQQITQRLEQERRQLAGWEQVSFSIAPDEQQKEQFLQKMVVSFNPQAIDPAIRKMFSCSAVENKSLEFVPRQVLAYQWSNCFNLKEQWQQFKNRLDSPGTEDSSDSGNIWVEQASNYLKDQLPTDFKSEMMSAFGDEMGSYIRDITSHIFFPLPQLVFFIKVKDEQAALRALSQVMGMNLKENYRQFEIKTLSISLGKELQPAYAMVNHYLLVAVHQDLIKEAIDTVLDSNKKNLQSPFQSTQNAFFQIQLGELNTKIRTLLSWGITQSLAQIAQNKAAKAKMLEDLTVADQEVLKATIDKETIDQKLATLKQELRAIDRVDYDIADQLKRLDQYEQELKKVNRQLDRALANQEDLDSKLKNFKELKVDSQQLQLNFDKGVVPLLNALEYYQKISAQVIYGPNRIETQTIIKIKP